MAQLVDGKGNFTADKRRIKSRGGSIWHSMTERTASLAVIQVGG